MMLPQIDSGAANNHLDFAAFATHSLENFSQRNVSSSEAIDIEMENIWQRKSFRSFKAL